jgi:hypothetical protein
LGQNLYAVNSPLSSIYGELGVPVAWDLQEPNFHVIFTIFLILPISFLCFKVTTHFHFSSCMGVLWDGIVDWCLKDFRYAIMWWQIQVACTVITHHCAYNDSSMREDDGPCC